jgi:hypothetical protein
MISHCVHLTWLGESLASMCPFKKKKGFRFLRRLRTVLLSQRYILCVSASPTAVLVVVCCTLTHARSHTYIFAHAPPRSSTATHVRSRSLISVLALLQTLWMIIAHANFLARDQEGQILVSILKKAPAEDEEQSYRCLIRTSEVCVIPYSVRHLHTWFFLALALALLR